LKTVSYSCKARR